MKRPQWVDTFISLGFLFLLASLVTVVVEAAEEGSWVAHWTRDSQDQMFFTTHVPRQEQTKGYVSSDRCASCHTQEYESWHQSFHRTMTQWAQPDTVHADFDNVHLSLNGKTYNLSRQDDQFWVDLENPDVDNPTSPQPRVSRRVGMLTGSHHMQFFWIPSIPEIFRSTCPLRICSMITVGSRRRRRSCEIQHFPATPPIGINHAWSVTPPLQIRVRVPRRQRKQQ